MVIPSEYEVRHKDLIPYHHAAIQLSFANL